MTGGRSKTEPSASASVRIFGHALIPGESWHLRPDGSVVYAVDSVDQRPVAIAREMTDETEASLRARVATGELRELVDREDSGERCGATCHRGQVSARCGLNEGHDGAWHEGAGMKWRRVGRVPKAKPKTTPTHWRRSSRSNQCPSRLKSSRSQRYARSSG